MLLTMGCRFLLACLHIEALSRQPSRRAVRNALKNLPTSIHDTYNHMMQRVRSQAINQSLMAERVISWLLVARRPLTMLEVQHLYAMQLREDIANLPENMPREGPTPFVVPQ